MTATVGQTTPSSALLATMNGTSATQSATQAQQNQFMTLLVTQMQNQDPLNPMDNSQMTSQFAQLSTVTGIDKLNTSIQSFMGNFQASQSLQAANMIGHGVLVAGSNIQLTQSKAIYGVDLPSSAGDVQVSIMDGSGKKIRTIDLGSQAAGTQPFAWDGKTDKGDVAPDGSYTFKVTASNGSSAVTANPLAFGTVASVSSTATGVNLYAGNLGNVAMSDVKQIL